jgi:predicted phosphodiesterase
MSIIQQAVMELLAKFPKIASQTAAKILYRDNKSLFPNQEYARSAVRMARGAMGKKMRREVPAVASPTPFGVDAFGSLPEGKAAFADWDSVKIEGKHNALILSDAHIPYHVKTPIVEAIKFGKNNGADLIILNGDTADFFSVSFWEKDPRKRDFKGELKTVREFLATLRAQFPKARIVYKLGNHEERWERYMRVKAPELLGVPEFEIKEMLHLTKHGIELVEDKRAIKLGDLNVLHGHEYRFAISNPVNPARGLFLRCKAFALCGHMHQSSYHQEKTVEQTIVATWSTGCLCDLHPEYSPYNNWCHGFAFVEVSADGKFNVQNKIVRHGKIY